MENAAKPGDEPLIMPWLFSRPFRKQHPEKVKEIKESLARGYLPKNSEEFARQTNANVAHDTRGHLYRIHAPVLILVGKDDELTPPRMAEELKSEIPRAELVIFERGGHGLYWEVPQLFNQAVLDFLNSQYQTQILQQPSTAA